MAEKPGKYAAALAAINEPGEDQPPAVVLPSKVLTGKRGRAGWRQKAVLLREESIQRATERLDRINKQRNTRTDFSDLMDTLLEAWLQTPQ